MVVSFAIFCICIATLKNYIDPEKPESSTNKSAADTVPSFGSLTDEGRTRYKVAIISLLIAMLSTAIIIIHNLIYGR